MLTQPARGDLDLASIASHYPGGRAPAICVTRVPFVPVVMWRLLTTGSRSCSLAKSGSPTELSGIYARGFDQFGLRRALARESPRSVPARVCHRPLDRRGCRRSESRRRHRRVPAALRRKAHRLAGVLEDPRVLGGFTGMAIALAMLGPPPTGVVSTPTIFLSIASFVPLVRFPLAALAFDWNRHR